jgi:protein-S-isoprenylcysteine O-methyltransferase Ste14
MTLLPGLVVAALGELLRLWAAGHLIKEGPGLSRAGPYRWTRNPLYLGSLLLGLGFAVASGRWQVVASFAAFFAAVYLPVMREEARHLSTKHPEAYRVFAREVPLFFPRPPAARSDAGTRGAFSWRRVRANGEHYTVLGWVAGAAYLWLRAG